MRTRDRESQKGLLPRMEARPLKNGGFAYRYHPVGAKPIALGRDLRAALRKVLDLTGQSSDRGTFAAYWRQYQTTPNWRRLAESTQAQYTDNWGELAKRFGKTPVATLRPKDVARYLRVERAEAPIVANREVALLSNLCNLAVEMGDIDRNPCKEVRRNPETPRTTLVEAETLRPFVAWALKQGESAVVVVSMAEFAALGGSRRAEFRTIHWPQVDEDLVRLKRAKQRGGREKREVLRRSEALDVVLARMKALPSYNPMGPVFAAPKTGNAYTDSGFKTMWGRLLQAAMAEGVIKERFTFHDLRAHYATYHKERFGTLPEMHESPATTQRVYNRAKTVGRDAL